MQLKKHTRSILMSFLTLSFFTSVYSQDLLLEESSLLERLIEKSTDRFIPDTEGWITGSGTPFLFLTFFTAAIKAPEDISS